MFLKGSLISFYEHMKAIRELLERLNQEEEDKKGNITNKI